MKRLLIALAVLAGIVLATAPEEARAQFGYYSYYSPGGMYYTPGYSIGNFWYTLPSYSYVAPGYVQSYQAYGYPYSWGYTYGYPAAYGYYGYGFTPWGVGYRSYGRRSW